MSSVQSDIYEHVLAASEPYRFCAPWIFVPADPSCRRLTGSPEVLLTSLRQRFTPKQLRASHVVVRGANGEERLNARLGGSDGAVLLLLRDAEGQAFDLLTVQGSLHPGLIGLFNLLRDASTQSFVQLEDPMIFAACSMQDVVLLRSLGVAAVPMNDLARLNQCGLNELMRYTTDAHRAETTIPGQPGTGITKFSLMLLAFSISSRSDTIPSEFWPVAARIGGAASHLHYSFWEVSVCLPSDRELQNLKFRCVLGSVPLMKAFVVDQEGFFDPLGFLDPHDIPDPNGIRGTLVRSLRALQAAQQDVGHDATRLRKLGQAQREYVQMLDRDVVTPLLESALADEDPLRRNLGMHLAQVARTSHLLMSEIQGCLLQDAEYAPNCASSSFQLPPQWKCVESLSRMLLATSQQLTRLRDQAHPRNGLAGLSSAVRALQESRNDRIPP